MDLWAECEVVGMAVPGCVVCSVCSSSPLILHTGYCLVVGIAPYNHDHNKWYAVMVQSTNATLHSTIRQIAIIVSALSPCLSIPVSSFIACLLVGLSQLPSLSFSVPSCDTLWLQCSGTQV